MIGTDELAGAAFSPGYNGGVVAADVVEGAHPVVLVTHHQEGLMGKIAREIVPHRLQLFHSPHRLPVVAKDRLILQFLDAGVEIPGTGWGWRFLDRKCGVEFFDLLSGLHGAGFFSAGHGPAFFRLW